jgi:hypothetical protein
MLENSTINDSLVKGSSDRRTANQTPDYQKSSIKNRISACFIAW